MNRETYRKAFDAIPFSPDFQARTVALLREGAHGPERKDPPVKGRRPGKVAVLAAAVAALLVVSVSAAVFFHPSQMARRMGQETLAAAFESGEAVLLNESAVVGDYTITLMGLVSGDALTGWDISEGEDMGSSDRTYVAYTIARTDGSPLEGGLDASWRRELTVTPLAAGYSAGVVNIWTLEDATSGFLEDGIEYCIMSTQTLEIFADRPMYLGACIGGELELPAIFPLGEDGTHFVAEGETAALFTLPLDPSKADPAAAQAFAKSFGGSPTEGAIRTED